MTATGNTFYIILGTLCFGPKSGYDIKKSIEDSTGEFWKVNYGQIYPILKTMMRDGYTVLSDGEGPDEVKDEHRTGRKVYRVTEKGRDAFLEWLSQPINFNNPQGNELLVKLFFGRFISTDISIQRIKEFKSKCLIYQNRMNEIQADIERLMPDNVQQDYSIIAVRNGQMAIEAKIAWCDECIERLSKRLNQSDRTGG